MTFRDAFILRESKDLGARNTMDAYHATNQRIEAWGRLMDATFNGASKFTLDRLSDAYDKAKAAETEAIAKRDKYL